MKGISVMLCEIFDRPGGEPLKQGKIASITVSDTELVLRFEDGTGYRFADGGQSCCESRYMRTDDKPEEFVGATFQSAELADGGHTPDRESYGEHEIQFLRLHTDRGDFVVSNHNEHNGYYGGFCLHVNAL